MVFHDCRCILTYCCMRYVLVSLAVLPCSCHHSSTEIALRCSGCEFVLPFWRLAPLLHNGKTVRLSIFAMFFACRAGFFLTGVDNSIDPKCQLLGWLM
eukprot:s104_g35.t1